MTRAPFTQTVQVRLDSSGNSLIIGGIQSECYFSCFSPTGKSWTVERITVACTSRTKEAMCRVFRGIVSDANEVSRTYSGSSGDTDSELHQTLGDGEFLNVVWTDGDPNATATATIQGFVDVPDRGFRSVI